MDSVDNIDRHVLCRFKNTYLFFSFSLDVFCTYDLFPTHMYHYLISELINEMKKWINDIRS